MNVRKTHSIPLRVAATSFALWGFIHIIGGILFVVASQSGPEAFLNVQTSGRYIATNEPISTGMSIMNVVASYHSFNLIWIGLLVGVTAVLFNWKNKTGSWLFNFALVGFTDLGLLVFVVRSDVLTFAEALPGVALLLLSAGAFLLEFLTDRAKSVSTRTI